MTASEHRGRRRLASPPTALVLGGLVTIIPMIALFALLSRYWRSGLLLGSVAN